MNIESLQARITELEAEVVTLKRHWIEDDRDLEELAEHYECNVRMIADLRKLMVGRTMIEVSRVLEILPTSTDAPE